MLEDYYTHLCLEVDDNVGALDAAGYAELRRYYRALAHNHDLRPFYRYNWQRRVTPMVDALQSLPVRDRPWQILDAGCGVGTEALLWATLRTDVEVTGVDLSADRLHTARARVQERRAGGEDLAVAFKAQNVFDLLKRHAFDIIWSMEAISHIDPAEAFLSAAAQNLSPGGKLVISDSHLLNPAMLLRIARLRRRGIRHTHKVLSSGEQVPYAEERLFGVGTLTRLLVDAGFTDVATQLSIFMPPRLARATRLFRLATRLDRAMNQAPLLRRMGGIYTVVATR